jgi:hypothetical protein
VIEHIAYFTLIKNSWRKVKQSRIKINQKKAYLNNCKAFQNMLRKQHPGGSKMELTRHMTAAPPDTLPHTLQQAEKRKSFNMEY